MTLKDNFYDIGKNCTFENDKLDRKSLAVNLTNILSQAETDTQGLILSLNAQWGNGKTTFIKMWKNMLDKDYKIPSLYFSAWEEDYAKEPLIAVLGELNKYLMENKIQNKNFDEVMKFTQKIFQRTLPALLKISVKGLFNKIGIDNELLQEFSQILTEDSAKTLIENYSKEKECLVQLKENLTKVFEATGAKEGQPFIVFIDELDRCRPTYAIEMLENIKHLFGIPHLVFVISIDKAQLSRSIQAIYGQIDTENYLRRFFDLEFTLPNPSPQKFCEYLQERLKIQTNLAEIFIADNFTLRELQKIAPQIKLLEMQQYQSNNQEPVFDMKPAIFILLIKFYKPDLYLQIPNITDAEGIMEIAEKLACKEGLRLKEGILLEYIETVYGVCHRLYVRDSSFINNMNSFHQDANDQWYQMKDEKKNSVDLKEYSYIVQNYYDLLQHKGYCSIHVKGEYQIIAAINFTSQFEI